MDTPGTVSSIVFIVTLIVPGVIFKRFYFKGRFKQQFGAGPFADRIITSIFWGIVVQIISFIIYSRALNFTYTKIHDKVETAYKVVMANYLPSVTYHDLGYILGYLLSSLAVAAIFGWFSHEFIRLFKIDIKSGIFRFSNEWHYYFTGEILSTKDFKHANLGKVLATEVDILIDNGGTRNKMVSGYLTQYSLSAKTGNLESIYLTGARRYSDNDKCYKDIPGECMIVPYSKVVDMNLRYLFKEATVKSNLRLYSNVVGIFSVLTILFFLIFPWFLSVSFGEKLVGEIFLMLGWTFSIALFSIPFQEEEKRLRGWSLILTLVLSLTTLVFAFYKLGIIRLSF